MKKIILISDTHSHLDEKLFKHIHEADEVWHAGDVGDIKVLKRIEELKPLRAVYGNIDGQDIRAGYPEHLVFNCESVKVYITHIGGYPGKYQAKAREYIIREKPKLFICGHSHILKVMYDETFQLLHMNPGACGIHGFHLIKTALRFTIDGTEIKDLAVIELRKRAE